MGHRQGDGSRGDDGGEVGGSDHGVDVSAWHPAYQHEVGLVARLRHVSCPEGCDETPAVVLRIDNADTPGEIAMTADDVSAVIESLVALRRSLLAPDRERPAR